MSPNWTFDPETGKAQLISGLSPMVVEHGNHPRNYGPLETFNGHAMITGPCGDTMEFWVQISNDCVAAIGFTTTGCGTSRAAGSMAAELALGKPLAAAAAVSQPDILAALGGLPLDAVHCALLASNTLKAAVQDYQLRS